MTIYRFHQANIHEKRCAAIFARCTPLLILLAILAVVGVSVFCCVTLLLWTCAVLNVTVWAFFSSSSAFALLMCWLDELPNPKPVKGSDVEAVATPATVAEASEDVVQHLIVIPNYKEDLETLRQTLEALRDADGSENFIVVLANEQREGETAKNNTARLQQEFPGFRRVIATYHPANLDQEHLDGGCTPEVAGKASNMKWAVSKSSEEVCDSFNLQAESVMLTVLDSDVIFHPCYFSRLSAEVRGLDPVARKWTMWQAPQIQGRNFGTSYAPSRIWGYAQVVFELGGVASLKYHCHHMTFSSYSVSLALAKEGDLWDGDVIAEDHHAFLKAFFYSAHQAATAVMREGSSKANPLIRVKPLLLPSKSTAVETENGWWDNWKARWDQSRRHSRGVSELSYFMLASFDMVTSYPWLRMPFGYNISLLASVIRIFLHLVTLHVFLIAQGVALGVLTLYWLYNGRSIPMCPDTVWFFSLEQATRWHTTEWSWIIDEQVQDKDGTLVCGLAGAWSLMWPVVVPLMLALLANFHVMCTYFIATTELPHLHTHALQAPEEQKVKAAASVLPPAYKPPLWHREDGQIKPICCSKVLGLRCRTFFDSIVLLGPILALFNLTAEVIALFEVCWLGNIYDYKTAARVTGPSYGATD